MEVRLLLHDSLADDEWLSVNPSLLSRVSLLSLGGQRGREGQRKVSTRTIGADLPIVRHPLARLLSRSRSRSPAPLRYCLRRRRAGRAKVNEDAATGLTQVRNLPQDLPGATMLPLPI